MRDARNPLYHLRSPDVVMRFDRLGAAFPTRLSFLRALMRRMKSEAWAFSRPIWAIDRDGYGHAIYRADTPQGPLSLVAFSTPLADADRTDRVIAEAWDTSYVLYDGVPETAEIDRLAANAPRQEAGRFSHRDLVLSRANRSVRLFDRVVNTLAEGRQPDAHDLASVGYLMRTTAVYGNGKFGIADRERLVRWPALRGSFRAEMLTVWLIRSFTVDLAEAIAAARAPAVAVVIEPQRRRLVGVGNSTGLGMAPFLVRHPALLDRWVSARETAIARVRSLPSCDADGAAVIAGWLAKARSSLTGWTTADPDYGARVTQLGDDLAKLAELIAEGALSRDYPFERLQQHAECNLSTDTQELLASLLLEPYGELVDDLAEAIEVDEAATFWIDGSQPVASLAAAVDRRYEFALATDFSKRDEQARFWYTSVAKLEPRLGERFEEPGGDLEQPLSVARDVVELQRALGQFDGAAKVSAFLASHPEHRHIIRRVQGLAHSGYGEIRENLLSAKMRPLDLLRAKLAFFGATRFDPRSDRWLRVTLFQGAPFPHEFAHREADDWIYDTVPC